MFLYRDILKKSLAITWQHKYLWFFGIFAALLGGVGQYSMSFSQMPENWSSNIFSAFVIFFNGAANGHNIIQNLIILFQRDPISMIILTAFLLITIVVFLFFLWLAVISQAGLINNSAKIIENDGKKDKTTLKEGLVVGLKKFWSVLGFNLIAAALILFFAALVGLPLVFLTPQSGLDVFLLYVLLFVLFIPLALIIYFLVNYSICFLVIKKHKFVDSFISAFRLFEKNWLISLEMALILFIIDFLVVVVLGVAFLILAIPFIFTVKVLSLIVYIAIGLDFSQWAMTAGILISLLIVVLAGAAVTCFKAVAWTDIFIHLVDKKGGVSKIARIAASLKK